MWNEITSASELSEWMEKMCYFHDSCIKEMRYISGAYVGEDLGMHPVNDRRVLSVIIQRQFDDAPMLELEFEGLHCLKLFPVDSEFTCEILDSTMLWKDGRIYWCDEGGLSEADLDCYGGTLVCASGLRWRPIQECMGKKDFFVPIM